MNVHKSGIVLSFVIISAIVDRLPAHSVDNGIAIPTHVNILRMGICRPIIDEVSHVQGYNISICIITRDSSVNYANPAEDTHEKKFRSARDELDYLRKGMVSG